MIYNINRLSLKCSFKIFRHTVRYISSLRRCRGQTYYASMNQLHQPQLGLQGGKSFPANFLKLSKNFQNVQQKKKKLEFFHKCTRNCPPICSPNPNMSEQSLLSLFMETAITDWWLSLYGIIGYLFIYFNWSWNHTHIYLDRSKYSSQHLKWIKKVSPKTRTHFGFRLTLMKGFDPLQMLTTV